MAIVVASIFGIIGLALQNGVVWLRSINLGHPQPLINHLRSIQSFKGPLAGKRPKDKGWGKGRSA